MKIIKEFLKKMMIERHLENTTYLKRYRTYSFQKKPNSWNQYEAVITRLYHTIEKGLSYQNYRAGFGQDNVNELIQIMEQYILEGGNVNQFFYCTALSVLNEYIIKNEQFGWKDDKLNKKVYSLKGKMNQCGGTIEYIPSSKEQVQQMGFEEFVRNRHSVRAFSKGNVSLNDIKRALEIAQFTPSACNRQGWSSIIVSDKEVIKNVLTYQNGNRGFSDQFDKLLLIIADLSYFNRERETYQAFIDGGMYAQNVINALHYMHIGTIPLSASLTDEQESMVRKILGLKESEILILFIGCGLYLPHCLTTRSERHKPKYRVI